MADDTNLWDRATARMMALDNPAYGDEREKSLFFESSTFGMTVGMYACMALALITAACGQLLAPVLLLVAMSVPSWATLWYGHRKGIDVTEMASRASRRTQLLTGAMMAGVLALVMAAMLFTVSTGEGLIPIPEPSFDGGVDHSIIRGALIGGIAGGAIGGVFTYVAGRRANRRRLEEEAVADLGGDQ